MWDARLRKPVEGAAPGFGRPARGRSGRGRGRAGSARSPGVSRRDDGGPAAVLALAGRGVEAFEGGLANILPFGLAHRSEEREQHAPGAGRVVEAGQRTRPWALRWSARAVSSAASRPSRFLSLTVRMTRQCGVAVTVRLVWSPPPHEFVAGSGRSSWRDVPRCGTVWARSRPRGGTRC